MAPPIANVTFEPETWIPENHRKHYTQDQIDYLYVLARTDENKSIAAMLLGRTIDAIDFVMSSCIQGGSVGPRRSRVLTAQIELAAKRLGTSSLGSVLHAPLAFFVPAPLVSSGLVPA